MKAYFVACVNADWLTYEYIHGILGIYMELILLINAHMYVHANIIWDGYGYSRRIFISGVE